MIRSPFPRTPVASIMAMCAFVAACSLDPAQASPNGYTKVRPPTVVMEPRTVLMSGGQSLIVQAKPEGGEAIRFSIDWEIQEAPYGGSIRPIGGRSSDGTYQAQYQAPTEGSGPFHLIARIHEYPGAFASTTINVRTEPAPSGTPKTAGPNGPS